tara:strand:+ start:2024 stop:2218 length:195 start_codon:yes stop_codon:yes gene_type:complete
MAKKYYSMNEVPIGTKMKIKETGEEVFLVEIQNFPTTFKVKKSNGVTSSCFTYEVEIENWPPSE